MLSHCVPLLLQVCGKGPATTPEKLEAALFDGLANSQPQTVQGAFSACSYGNADFSKGDSGVQVVPVTVPIPCKGTTPWNLPFDSSTCPYVGERQAAVGLQLQLGQQQTHSSSSGGIRVLTANIDCPCSSS